MLIKSIQPCVDVFRVSIKIRTLPVNSQQGEVLYNSIHPAVWGLISFMHSFQQAISYNLAAVPPKAFLIPKFAVWFFR
jgi:hypothetical protein